MTYVKSLMIIQWNWCKIQGIRSDRQTAWGTMDGGLHHCTGSSDQNHPQEKERQNGCLKRPYKYLRKKGKGKGEKERYSYLKAEFWRIAVRDKKAFIREECKETEENNRMGKTSDVFQKIRNTKGTFHAKIGTIKDRKCLDLRETEDIKRKWQEYTAKLYKKKKRS